MTAKKMNVAECTNRKSIDTKVLVLVLAILFKSSTLIVIGIGNIFAKVLLLELTTVFTSIVNISGH